MSVGVIGQCYVGGSLTTVFSERGETVYVFDIAGKCAAGGISEFADTARPASVTAFVEACEGVTRFSGIFFVCVPTPMSEDGAADVSIVESVLEGIADSPRWTEGADRIAVIKSTVPPGSVEEWNARFGKQGLGVIFNPEFVTEANAISDMREQGRIVLGGPRSHVNRVRDVYHRSFPTVPVIETSASNAEMVKYLTNCMLAVKVSFANEIAQICEALGEHGLNIDYDKVVEYAKLDRRLGESHRSVPGPVPTHDGRYVRGFGGNCLPKDINALIRVAYQCGVDAKVMKAAWEKTLEVRAPEDRDWEHQVGRAVSKRPPQ